MSVALSPDGKLLASGGFEGTLLLWNIPAGTIRARLRGHTTIVRRVQFSPTGSIFASAGSDGIKIWDLAAVKVAHTLNAPHMIPDTFAFAPDGRRLAAGSELDDPGIRLWNPLTARADGLFKVGHATFALAYAPDGRSLAVAGTTKQGAIVTVATLLNASSGSLLYYWADGVPSRAVAFSPDSRILALGDSLAIWVWEIGRSKLRSSLHVPGTLQSLAYSPDGRILVGAVSGDVILWRVE